MRILHTGDWHLGAHTGGVSRTPDFELFFAWLRDVIATREVDVLVVAGDVFEHAQPSAEALTLYYDFLSRLAGSRLRAVIIVGGNHDSAARLDAPRDLLSRLAIHVIGGLPSGLLEPRESQAHAADAALARALVRVDDVVFAAVPYLHEYRLGVRQSAADADAASVRAALADAFRRLYRQLADRAATRWPDAHLVATGHLVAAGARLGDWGAHIHQVGLIGALPADIFDTRFDYVALGHLHRAFAVRDEPPVWYSGSPIALTLEEASTPRQVMIVDVGAGPAAVRPLQVPSWRDIVAVDGPPAALIEALTRVDSQAPLPPLVHVKARVEGWVPSLDKGLAAALDKAGVGARIIALHQLGPESDEAHTDAAPLPRVPLRLTELDPESIFLRLAAARGEPIDATLLEAFRGLLT